MLKWLKRFVWRRKPISIEPKQPHKFSDTSYGWYLVSDLVPPEDLEPDDVPCAIWKYLEAPSQGCGISGHFKMYTSAQAALDDLKEATEEYEEHGCY
jgi:hypothetical protein